MFFPNISFVLQVLAHSVGFSGCSHNFQNPTFPVLVLSLWFPAAFPTQSVFNQAPSLNQFWILLFCNLVLVFAISRVKVLSTQLDVLCSLDRPLVCSCFTPRSGSAVKCAANSAFSETILLPFASKSLLFTRKIQKAVGCHDKITPWSKILQPLFCCFSSNSPVSAVYKSVFAVSASA